MDSKKWLIFILTIFIFFGLNDIFEMPFYIRDVSVFLRYIRIRIRWISVISANDFCPKPLSFDMAPDEL